MRHKSVRSDRSPTRYTVSRIVVVLIVCQQCTSGAARDAVESSVTVLHNSNEWVLSPTWDDTPKFLMFLPLVNYEQGSYCGNPTPALAERWAHSDDYRVWTVWLKDDILWHDGVPVTAHDIKFTIDLWNHPDVQNYNGAQVDSTHVLDQHTVRVYLGRPDRWPLEGWAAFFPKHLLQDLDPARFNEWEFWTRPVGNGPYRYVRHVPQTLMELEANPYYYRGKPQIERVTLRFQAGGSGTGLLEMQSGNIDLNPTLSLLEAKAVSNDPRFRTYYRVSSSHNRWLLFNPHHPPFADERIRRALAHVIDRRLLHEALDFPENVLLTDAPYSVCQFFNGETAEPWPYDPTVGIRLLEDAGWRDQNGDGVRESQGVPLRFTVIVEADERRAAIVLQDQLRRVGLQMEVQTLDGNVVMARLRANDYEAAIPPYVSIQGILAATPTNAPVADTMLAASYPRIVSLIDSIRHEPEFARSERMSRELADEFRSKLPAIFLYPLVTPIVAHRRIRGFDHDGWIPPAWRWAFGGLEWLWIEGDEG